MCFGLLSFYLAHYGTFFKAGIMTLASGFFLPKSFPLLCLELAPGQEVRPWIQNSFSGVRISP